MRLKLPKHVIKSLKGGLDSLDIWLTLYHITGLATFITRMNIIVRAIRGEDAKEDWRTTFWSSAFIAFSVLTAGGRIRGMVRLRDATVELRGLAHDEAEEAKLRDQRAAERERQAAERDQRATEQQERMLRLTKWLVAFAVLTLVAAIVTAW